ncbi:hypothetical protein SANTM175S_07428 [Streptomyces antimycoticus]
MATDTARAAGPAGVTRQGSVLVEWLTTTDHKKIGHLYLISSFGFFLVGGALALVMRAELARPGLQVVSREQFDQAFTLHGTIMLLLFATPAFAGFANEIMPLQIGAPDVAFPRLEHAVVLAVSVRRADGADRSGGAAGRRGLRLDRLCPAQQRDPLPRCRRRSVDHGAGAVGLRDDPGRGELPDHHHRRCARRA